MSTLNWAICMNSIADDFHAEFGIGSVLNGSDFRPHFDGWLYNVARLISPSPSREEHTTKVWAFTREMAAWLLARQARFQPMDRFQLIVGWPEQIRRTSRQIIKLGGSFDELARIAAADESATYEAYLGYPILRRGWDVGIYDPPSQT